MIKIFLITQQTIQQIVTITQRWNIDLICFDNYDFSFLQCLLFYGLPGPTINDFMLHPSLPTPDLKPPEDSQGESDSTTYPRVSHD